MIPVRIQVAGFLCYREPQEACFDGRTLWMLAGPNGSGKSALFDAVTFALFGQHRGGKRLNARNLIHHGCNGLAVEFDFRLDDQVYRVRRTLSQNGRSTRQVLAWSASQTDQCDAWTAVPQTHTERGFSRWIDVNIALSYETFTASVLLLQGQADNLLLATPAQKHRLLCQIVGLDKITQLADRAQHHLVETLGAEQACQQQLDHTAKLEETKVATLQQDIAAADRQIVQCTSQIDELTSNLALATRCQHLTNEIAQLHVDTKRLSRQCADRERQEAHSQQRVELSTQLAALRKLQDSLTRLQQCKRRIAAMETRKNAAEANLTRVTLTLDRTEESAAGVRQQLLDTATRDKHLSQQLAESTLAHSLASRYAQACNSLQKVRISQADLERKLLETHQQQDTLHVAEPLDDMLDDAHKALESCVTKLAKCEAHAEQVQVHLQRFQSISGKRTCPYCHQQLNTEHYRQEEQKLKDDLRDAQAALEQTQHDCDDAITHERSRREECENHQAECTRLCEQERTLTAEMQGIRIVVDELTDQWHHTLRALPANLRTSQASEKPPGRLAGTFPTGEELSVMRKEIDSMDRELDRLGHTTRELHGEMEQLLEQKRLQVAKQRTSARELDLCRERLASQRSQLPNCSTVHESNRMAVPPQWRNLSVDELSPLIRTMEAQCPQQSVAEELHTERDVEQMKHQHQLLMAKLEILTEERARIPQVAQCPAKSLALQLNEAREQRQLLETRRAKLQSELLASEQLARSRAVAEQQLRATTHRCQLWKQLVTLLGRDGLQRALLEAAEHAIVQYANTILDRLSGGRLYIELAQPASDQSSKVKALQLVACTTDAALQRQDVAFLSGSQKFRVAVALSLAIGQFASNTRRPVQAVIIDEGFGCLDTTNRNVMIQELNNLRGQLQRILLVSHQDEFASAFPDGYRCELVNGATRLSAFHA